MGYDESPRPVLGLAINTPDGLRTPDDDYPLVTKSAAGNIYTTTISGTTSEAIEFNKECRVAQVLSPSGLAATTFTFLGSIDGVTYTQCYDQYGQAVSIKPTDDAFTLIEPLTGVLLGALRYMKIVSSATQDIELTVVTAGN